MATAFEKSLTIFARETPSHIFYVIIMLLSFAYCLIVALFVSWSSRTKSSFSSFYCSFVKSGFVLYFTVFVWIKEIVVKVKLENITSH